MIDSKKLIKEYSLTPNKALGQNFLTDVSAVHRICELADCSGKTVLEIGPGLGVLTDALSESAEKVIAVEIDKSMVEILSAILRERKNIRIINADFLKLSKDLIAEEIGGKPFTVAANLPYYITSQIVQKLIHSELPITRMVLMMQKEASEHFTAEPRTKCYTAQSVLTQRYYNVSSQFKLTPSCYYPEPTVNSAVLLFERNEIAYDRFFEKFVKAAFSMRRKTLRKNLAQFTSKNDMPQLFDRAGLSSDCRAEELTVEQFALLAEACKDAFSLSGPEDM